MTYPNTLLGRLDEAIAFMRKRVPITDAEFEALQRNASEQAFWVAGTQQLGSVAAIQESLARAIEQGQTYEDWRAAIGDTLREQVVNHARTVYRNATQTAYNNGRIEQMRSAAVKRARPYWTYDAIGGKSGDGRTTDICRNLHGTILPADDQAWDSIKPPNHHNCRSRIRAITASQAQRFGGVTPVNDNDIPVSFRSPTTGKDLVADYDRSLVSILESKAS